MYLKFEDAGANSEELQVFIPTNSIVIHLCIVLKAFFKWNLRQTYVVCKKGGFRTQSKHSEYIFESCRKVV